MAPVVAELMSRAQAAGQLREDIGPQDFPLLQILLGAVIDVSRDALARSVAALSRADPAGHAGRAGAPAPLRVAVPGFEQMDQVLRSWRPPRRA